MIYQCSTANRGEVLLGPVAEDFLDAAPFLAFPLAGMGLASSSSSPVDALTNIRNSTNPLVITQISIEIS